MIIIIFVIIIIIIIHEWANCMYKVDIDPELIMQGSSGILERLPIFSALTNPRNVNLCKNIVQ